MSTLFISYSTKDRVTADIVYQKLIEMGYEPPFRDDQIDTGIPAGSEWEQELYRKLRLCKSLIVLCSKNWLESKWCFAELAYAKAMGKEFFPIRIDNSADLPTSVGSRQAISLEDPDVWHRLQRGLVEAGLAPENDFPWPVTGIDECPYPGLASFETSHAGVYFGRDDEILEIRERLNQMTARGTPRLLYIMGASGSGKSSLINAGLLPRLTKKKSRDWCLLRTFRWNDVRAGGHGWREHLAIDIATAWPSGHAKQPNWRELSEKYADDPLIAANHFIDDIKDLLFHRDQPYARALLFVDQFEELLSTDNDNAAKQFLEFLGGIMSSPRSPCICVATVRTDFFTAIQTQPELVAWKDHADVYSLPLMKRERVFDVVRKPADKIGITFESDALVNQIVEDSGTSDALPLLAFALRELYEQFGSDRHFTIDEYQNKLGGLEGCLTRVADDLIHEIPTATARKADQRKLLIAFSSHLVRVNNDPGKFEFIRRTAPWSEFKPEVQQLLQRFIDRRLIISRLQDEADPRSARVIDVAHEALFRTWDTLRNWLAERRDLLRWRQDVEQSRAAAGSEWTGLTRAQLGVASEWPRKRREELTEAEIRWIEAAKARVRNSWLALAATALLFAGLSIVAGLQWWSATAAKLRVDDALATSLLNALEERDAAVSSIELQSLMQVAQTPTSDQRIRTLFLHAGLRSTDHARKLDHRCDYAVRASLGLNLSVRQQAVDEIVLPALGPEQPIEVRAAAARLGIHARETGKEFAEKALLTALEMVKKNKQLELIVSEFPQLSLRLEKTRAATLVPRFVAALADLRTIPQLQTWTILAVPLSNSLESSQYHAVMIAGVEQFGKIPGFSAGGNPRSPIITPTQFQQLCRLFRTELPPDGEATLNRAIAKHFQKVNMYSTPGIGDMVKVFGELQGDLDSESRGAAAYALANQMVAIVDGIDGVDDLKDLANEVKLIAPHLLQEDARRLAVSISNQLPKTVYAHQNLPLWSALPHIGRHLDKYSGQMLVKSLLEEDDDWGVLNAQLKCTLEVLPKLERRDVIAALTTPQVALKPAVAGAFFEAIEVCYEELPQPLRQSILKFFANAIVELPKDDDAGLASLVETVLRHSPELDEMLRKHVVESVSSRIIVRCNKPFESYGSEHQEQEIRRLIDAIGSHLGNLQSEEKTALLKSIMAAIVRRLTAEVVDGKAVKELMAGVAARWDGIDVKVRTEFLQGVMRFINTRLADDTNLKPDEVLLKLEPLRPLIAARVATETELAVLAKTIADHPLSIASLSLLEPLASHLDTVPAEVDVLVEKVIRARSSTPNGRDDKELVAALAVLLPHTTKSAFTRIVTEIQLRIDAGNAAMLLRCSAVVAAEPSAANRELVRQLAISLERRMDVLDVELYKDLTSISDSEATSLLYARVLQNLDSTEQRQLARTQCDRMVSALKLKSKSKSRYLDPYVMLLENLNKYLDAEDSQKWRAAVVATYLSSMQDIDPSDDDDDEDFDDMMEKFRLHAPQLTEGNVLEIATAGIEQMLKRGTYYQSVACLRTLCERLTPAARVTLLQRLQGKLANISALNPRGFADFLSVSSLLVEPADTSQKLEFEESIDRCLERGIRASAGLQWVDAFKLRRDRLPASKRRELAAVFATRVAKRLQMKVDPNNNWIGTFDTIVTLFDAASADLDVSTSGGLATTMMRQLVAQSFYDDLRRSDSTDYGWGLKWATALGPYISQDNRSSFALAIIDSALGIGSYRPDDLARDRTELAALLDGLLEKERIVLAQKLIIESSPQAVLLSQMIAERLSEEQIVELLKYPTCTRNAEKGLLETLSLRLSKNPAKKEHFGNIWEFVEHTRNHNTKLFQCTQSPLGNTPTPAYRYSMKPN